MLSVFFLFLILLAEHSGTIWYKHFTSGPVCTVCKCHVRKAKNAHHRPEWFLPLFFKPPLNDSSSWLLIGWDPAIPRDCLAEAERPCFHSQKHWYASRLFHSHKRLNIAPCFSMVFCSFPCVVFFCLFSCFTRACLIIPSSMSAFVSEEKRQTCCLFFFLLPARKERYWEGLQCEICSTVRAEAAYEWESVFQLCLDAPEDIFFLKNLNVCFFSTEERNQGCVAADFKEILWVFLFILLVISLSYLSVYFFIFN